MTRTRAYQILGITADANMTEIKKTYRQLMHQVHPDTDAFHTIKYTYTAQEINEAYAFLCRTVHGQEKSTFSKDSASSPKASYSRKTTGTFHSTHTGTASSAPPKQRRWNAPLNPDAYTERNIYHYVEDYDCSIIASIILDTGKFLWQPEEDFPLFLKSIMECSKKLLDEAEQKAEYIPNLTRRADVQAKLVYLLAQQFINASQTLDQLAKPSIKETCKIYHIPSMLELALQPPALPAGTALYPAAIRNHRLFLKTDTGQNAGYLSFHDDRMYYIVIPLFEQRRAQVKIRIATEQASRKTRNFNQYKNLDFWLKVPHTTASTFPENISLQIKNLLCDYAN